MTGSAVRSKGPLHFLSHFKQGSLSTRALRFACFARLAIAAGVLTLMPREAHAALIDDFESQGFSIESTANIAGPSVHLAADPLRVLGGDRDVWTLVHDGSGSSAVLEISSEDNGVKVTSNPTGSDYWVMFQYDGAGRNSLDLGANLLFEGDDAILVLVTEVFSLSQIDLQVSVITNAGETTEVESSLVLPVSGPGTFHFPLAQFSSSDGSPDFSDVDSISVIPMLTAASSITISEIRTGNIPEPASLLLALLGGSILCFHQPEEKRGRNYFDEK